MFQKKCVLLLGASIDQVYIIKVAHRLGLETAVIDGNFESPGLALSTYSEAINFSQIPAVIDYVHRLKKQGVNICGVSVMGSDVPNIIARIAHEFGWVGPSEQTGRWATDKYEMKCRFVELGIPVPSFSLVESEAQIRSYWDMWKCGQVIVKPTDQAGSRGVRIISEDGEIAGAFKNAFNSSKGGQVILEEFIPGLQVSTESILTEVKAMTPGFADRLYEGMEVFWPQVMENGGWVPSIINDKLKGEISTLVESAARALGIKRGVAKGDVVIHPEKGPMIIEMAARLSGGDFCESLVPLGSGVNYVESALKIAIGEEPVWSDLIPKFTKTVVNRYFFLPPGELQEIKGEIEVKRISGLVKLKYFYGIGDIIPDIQNHGQRVGVFILVGESREMVQEKVNFVYNNLRFKVNGNWCFASPQTRY